jgi:penicillin-binding protein 1B
MPKSTPPRLKRRRPVHAARGIALGNSVSRRLAARARRRAGGGLYGVHLDKVVRAKFEGKRWALPARVYARPLELYVGRALTRDES